MPLHKKGRKGAILILFIYVPIGVLGTTGICMFVLNINGLSWLNCLFFLLLLVYLVFACFGVSSGSRFSLAVMVAGLSSVIILLISNTYVLSSTIPLNKAYTAKVNLPHPWNIIIPAATNILLCLYLIIKFSEIDLMAFRKELKRKQVFNIVDKTFLVGPDRTRIIGSFYKKKPPKQHSVIEKKIENMWLNFLSWVILIAYYFLPPFAITLNQIDHERPFSWIVLFFSYYIVYVFAVYFFQRYYAYFRVYRQIEKEIGGPLQPRSAKK